MNFRRAKPVFRSPAEMEARKRLVDWYESHGFPNVANAIDQLLAERPADQILAELYDGQRKPIASFFRKPVPDRVRQHNRAQVAR